jgi:hypothetical protein
LFGDPSSLVELQPEFVGFPPLNDHPAKEGGDNQYQHKNRRKAELKTTGRWQSVGVVHRRFGQRQVKNRTSNG